MTVTLTADEIVKLKGSDPNKRYMVVYNGSDETIYPTLSAYDPDSNKLITDIDTVNLPSGFKLDPKTYKILTFPKYVISGRIIARTGCTMVPDLYGSGQDGLLCDTGDCHQSYDGTNTPSQNNTYVSSQKGLLCNVKNGEAPATVIEFSFTDVPGTDSRGQPMESKTDYYDVSQVDGNNLSAQIEPIINQAPKGGAGQDPNYWCQKAGCTATLKTCPPELKVYRQSDHSPIACQSIASALSGITTTIKPDRTPGVPGMYPGGHYNNNVGVLKDVDPSSFKKLTDMYLTNYYWDQSATNKGGDSRPWTKTGAWSPDADGSKCPLACTGSGDCSVPSTCITSQTLASCAGLPGNKCGDPHASKPEPPNFNGPADQGCSPNISTYDTPDYAPHLCWSENWPGQGPEYHKVFKDMCPGAYSWQFDDFSSTYVCNSVSDTPVHYFVQFYSYDGTPETLDLSTSKTSSFVSEDGAPFYSQHTSLFKKSIIAIIVLFLLILVLKLAL